MPRHSPCALFHLTFFRVLNSSLFENYSFFSFGFSTSAIVVFYPNFFVLKTLLCFVLPLLSRLIQFSRFYFEAASLFIDAGGLKWVRTIDLALIRRAL